jgi:hypothetical protein
MTIHAGKRAVMRFKPGKFQVSADPFFSEHLKKN